MMFSDVVVVFRTLFNLPYTALIPLLIFGVVFWFLGKIFRAMVLEGHWFVHLLAALILYIFAASSIKNNQYVLALMFGVPILFIGHRAYHNLRVML